jgi:hypothetical protein
MRTTPLYRALAGTADAYHRSLNVMASMHAERAAYIAREYLPSGSGFDAGTEFDLDSSSATKLTFSTSYRRMGESGLYEPTERFYVIARPCFVRTLTLELMRPDTSEESENADYIGETFHEVLLREYPLELLYPRPAAA